MVTDKVADLIIQIKNAGMVNKKSISIDYSKLKHNVLTKLYNKKYITAFETIGHGVKKKLLITLSYDKKGKHILTDVKRISKPGRRTYAGYKSIIPFKNGYGTIFLSTPKGILTLEEAKKENVGGELLFSIW